MLDIVNVREVWTNILIEKKQIHWWEHPVWAEIRHIKHLQHENEAVQAGGATLGERKTLPDAEIGTNILHSEGFSRSLWQVLQDEAEHKHQSQKETSAFCSSQDCQLERASPWYLISQVEHDTPLKPKIGEVAHFSTINSTQERVLFCPRTRQTRYGYRNWGKKGF